jgi:hypothetical protein
MKDIPPLFNIAYQIITVIAEALSEFDKTGIFPLHLDLFSDDDFISIEVPTTVTATVEMDRSSPIRGDIDSSHERNDNGSSRGVTDPSNKPNVAGTTRGDSDSCGGGIIIAEITLFPSTSGWQI